MITQEQVDNMTLEQACLWCLEMWDWIAERIREGSERQIGCLKCEYLNQSQFRNVDVNANCFWCHYCRLKHLSCFECLANDCTNSVYHYRESPLAFRDKVEEVCRKLGFIGESEAKP